MFAFSGRFRRRVAVLSVFALLAGVLVVASPAAAADPKANYKAMFTACIGAAADDAGFTDVPEGHANAGDINCIAYYGVTKGTSASTYAPLQSVNREQMALFLTRLAKTVGIDVDDEPDDAGFTDTADLSAESQMAINQLADLGITRGTSATTFSPSDPVTRDHMALFIARLMNKMTPLADGQVGLRSTPQYGYTPSDVEDNDKDADLGSPFTDLGQATKEEWDAITRLYELGVAAGITDTSYAPDEEITRASMAGFMAGVLNHSNARPTGLSVQATPPEGWGEQNPNIVISLRDDDFAAVADEAVDIFSTTDARGGIREDGTCNKGTGTNADDSLTGDLVAGDCEWDSNDPTTDAAGNIFETHRVPAGETRIFYVWQGNKSGDTYDADDFDAKTATVVANRDQRSIKTSSADVPANAHEVVIGTERQGKQVDLRNGGDVVVTAQLKDGDAGMGGDVKRAGVMIRVEYRQGPDFGGPRDDRRYVDSHEAILETDENGQVEFSVPAPVDSRFSSTQSRKDAVVFTEIDGDGNDVTPRRSAEYRIHWIEETPRLTSDTLAKPTYLLADRPTVSVRVHLWDQYGNPHVSHTDQRVRIMYTGNQADGSTAVTGATADEVVRVISRGYARLAEKLGADLAANQTIAVTYDVRQLARNSNGQPVRVPSGYGTAGSAAADSWLGLGDSSAQSRQIAIDALNLTYNDGAFISNDDTADAPAYADDPATTDEDLVIPYRSAPSGHSVIRAINPHALDIYVDRGANKVLATTDTRVPGLADQDSAAMKTTIWVVERADSEDVGNKQWDVVDVLKADRELLLDSHDADTDVSETDGNPELVFTYKEDDIFIDSTLTSGAEGRPITMAMFETLAAAGSNKVEVIAYDIDGTSIFRVHP